jgi:nitric oxide reductase subunit C
MTKRQTRIFAYVSSFGFAAVFLVLTFHSHSRFPELTHSQNITPEIVAGKDVWHKNNCINCHTLLGEGAYFAPDLTKITQQRGVPYLTAFLKDPAQFYSNQKHRRLMPNPNLNDEEIAQVIAFLDWVSKIDNQGWPPRPILVSGGTFPGTAAIGTVEGAPTEPGAGLTAHAAQGQAIFRSPAAACSACHSVSPGVNLAGPSLAGMAQRAEETVRSPDYHGEAKDGTGYILESIVKPSAYLVPGPMYSAGGVSFMSSNYAEQLKPDEIDRLVDYLLTLR